MIKQSWALVRQARAAVLASAIVLFGCGGGDSGSTVASASPEGAWQGTTTSGDTASLLILENGDAWGVYAVGNTIHGAVHGQVSVTGNSVTLTGTEFDVVARTAKAATYSGTVTAGQSIALANPSSGISFAAAYQASYDTPVPLSSLAGTYAGNAVDGITSGSFGATGTVSATGAVTVQGPDPHCALIGQATPRTTGKNVFDLAMRISGTCGFPNGSTLPGVLRFDAAANRVLAFAVDASGTNAFIYLGTKQ